VGSWITKKGKQRERGREKERADSAERSANSLLTWRNVPLVKGAGEEKGVLYSEAMVPHCSFPRACLTVKQIQPRHAGRTKHGGLGSGVHGHPHRSSHPF
jgi:hypothetical protein